MMDIDYAQEKSMILFIFTSAGGGKKGARNRCRWFGCINFHSERNRESWKMKGEGLDLAEPQSIIHLD